MASKHFCWVPDPRQPDADECLCASFTVSHFGEHPHGYAEHFDPGSGPEFELTSVVTEGHELVELTDEQNEAVEAAIVERFNFAEAKRDERDRDAYDWRDEEAA